MDSTAVGEEVLGWELGVGNEELGWRPKAGRCLSVLQVLIKQLTGADQLANSW